MKKVGIIGIGNAGNQVAALGEQILHIPVIAINTSPRDLETLPDTIKTYRLTTQEDQQGSGKDRNLAKEYLKKSITLLIERPEFKEFITGLEEIFIVSSTGGGTGSGTSPIMCSILKKVFVNTHFILVGITPVSDDGYSSQVNSLEYLKEVYEVMEEPTYMLYDNDRLSGKNLPSYKILETINEEIIKDIDVLRGTYCYTTKFDSIDDRDMARLIKFPGRIFVARVEDFKEKDVDNVSIDDMIIDKIKNNMHVELQRDLNITASGIITNLSQNLTEMFDDNVPTVRKFVGDPVHAFKHIYVNAERVQPNSVYYIMTGLSPVNDKMNKIGDRILEIEEAQKIREEQLALDSMNLDALTEKIKDKDNANTDEKIDLGDIFSRFGS